MGLYLASGYCGGFWMRSDCGGFGGCGFGGFGGFVLVLFVVVLICADL